MYRLVLAAALMLWFVEYSGAVTVAGQILAVAKDANVEGPSGNRELNTGETVGAGDLIITDQSGLVQLIFTDDTRLVVGPNSSLLIEAYLLETESRVSRFSARAFGGTFRFITGKSNSNAYEIASPTGTIGVRGTAFDMFVDPSGSTDLALLSGELQFCAPGGNCVDLTSPCEIATASSDFGARRVEVSDELKLRLETHFAFIISQEALRPEFRVNTESCNTTFSEVLPTETEEGLQSPIFVLPPRTPPLSAPMSPEEGRP